IPALSPVLAPPLTALYPLSLHDALPICGRLPGLVAGTNQLCHPVHAVGHDDLLSNRRRMSHSRAIQERAARSCSSFRSSLSRPRSEEHTSELQSPDHLVCRLLLEKKNNQ